MNVSFLDECYFQLPPPTGVVSGEAERVLKSKEEPPNIPVGAWLDWGRPGASVQAALMLWIFRCLISKVGWSVLNMLWTCTAVPMYVLTASSTKTTHKNPHSLLERREGSFHHAVISVCNEAFGFSEFGFHWIWPSKRSGPPTSAAFCVTRGILASLPLATTPFAGLPPLHFRWTKLQVSRFFFFLT